MNAATPTTPQDTARRMEELGRIILAYSDVTAKLEKSHDQLTSTVKSLQEELSEKNRLLERKNRLAALGEMAAGMAHEIRNPLGGIQLYASMLARDLADREESLGLVKKISCGVKRLEALVMQVLQFAREVRVVAAPMDLAAVIDQAVELATSAMCENQVRCAVNGPHPLHVTADPHLIGQTILNLLLNAVEAIGPGGGNVSISFSPPPTESNARQFHVALRDSGPGISPQVLDRIFNPFFTTKAQGTGLGLAIVHRVIEAHDGSILVTNPEGGGARFEIRV